MPKIPGSAVWVDGGSFAELENVGGRAGSRRGANDGFGFGLAELDSHCLIREKSSHVRMSNRMEIGKGYIQLLKLCTEMRQVPDKQEGWVLGQVDTPERGGW